MDAAQRGMGLDWPNALELIRRTKAAFPDAIALTHLNHQIERGGRRGRLIRSVLCRHNNLRKFGPQTSSPALYRYRQS